MELDSEAVKDETWDPVWGTDESNSPGKAMLDGQQRLSSLYYAIRIPKKKFPRRKSYYRWFLNPDRALNEQKSMENSEVNGRYWRFSTNSISRLKPVGHIKLGWIRRRRTRWWRTEI